MFLNINLNLSTNSGPMSQVVLALPRPWLPPDSPLTLSPFRLNYTAAISMPKSWWSTAMKAYFSLGLHAHHGFAMAVLHDEFTLGLRQMDEPLSLGHCQLSQQWKKWIVTKRQYLDTPAQAKSNIWGYLAHSKIYRLTWLSMCIRFKVYQIVLRILIYYFIVC